MENCIFCKIAKGEAPSHTFWQDDKHMAFLSIFPNTEGFSVIIPKEHRGSYIFSENDETMTGLMLAAKKAAKILEEKLPDVGRCGLMFEGFGVDHLHAKLFPMHGTKDMSKWQPINSDVKTYFDQYLGYMSSHNSERADDAKLSELAKRLRE